MCGIGGIINTSKQNFNKAIFNIIGIANDDRGKDSCGIFVDQKVEYGIEKTKLYKDFFYTSKLLESTKTCKIAFLHCRAASAGFKKDLAGAQPVTISEDGEIKFCLIHNGTIYNYEELAKKYIPEIDIKGLTDSQVMARIFYYKGYDVLSEYNGSAVFVIADYRKNRENPEIFFWKGESKDNAYSKKTSDERPFFFVSTKSSIYFSSIALQLDAIFGDENVYTIETNHLIRVNGTDIAIVKYYDRSKMTQSKGAITIYQSSMGYNYDNYNYDDDYDYGGYNRSSYYIYNSSSGEFMCSGNPLHGKKYCGASGTCYDYDFVAANYKWTWFYHGILLYNEDCYNLIEIIRKGFAKQNKAYESSKEFLADYPEIVSYFSYTPIKVFKNQDKYLIVNEDLKWEPFTGVYHNVFGNYNIYDCVDGKPTKRSGNSLNSFEKFKHASEAYYVDEDSFIELIQKTYHVSI